MSQNHTDWWWSSVHCEDAAACLPRDSCLGDRVSLAAFFQALLQKRNMSVITTWLSSPLHQTESQEDGDFHPFCHLTSSWPVPETAAYALLEAMKGQAVLLEDSSIPSSCSMTISLTYSWLNKSLALPWGCDAGPFFFVREVWSMSSDV